MALPLLVLVTGANQGIGYHISKILASQHHHHHILMGCRSVEAGNAAVKAILQDDNTIDPSRLEPIQLDLNSDTSIATAVQRVHDQFGKLDILVNNNAGFAIPPEGLSTREAMNAIYATNVSGTYAVTEAFLPLLRKSTAAPPGKRIIFVSSQGGSISSVAKAPHVAWKYFPYCCSKTAENMLAMQFVVRFRNEGENIVVVMTSPGHCATNLNEHSGSKSAYEGAESVVKSGLTGGMDVTGTFTKDGETISW